MAPESGCPANGNAPGKTNAQNKAAARRGGGQFRLIGGSACGGAVGCNHSGEVRHTVGDETHTEDAHHQLHGLEGVDHDDRTQDQRNEAGQQQGGG